MSLEELTVTGVIETGDARSPVYPVPHSVPIKVDRDTGLTFAAKVVRPGGARWDPPTETTATFAIWSRRVAEPATFARVTGTYGARGKWSFDISPAVLRSVPLGTHLYEVGVETLAGERAIIIPPSYFTLSCGGAF